MGTEAGHVTVGIDVETGSMDSQLESAKGKVSGLSSAFEESTTTLLAFGNIAQSTESIMSRFENQAIRVENAELRLIGARQDLNKLTAEGKKGTEEYDDALRRFTIAQNGLERAQNHNLGLYISTGVQITNILVALPKAITSFISLTRTLMGAAAAQALFNAVTNPASVLLMGVAITATTVALLKAKSQLDINTTATEKYTSTLKGVPSEVKTNVILETSGKTVAQARAESQVSDISSPPAEKLSLIDKIMNFFSGKQAYTGGPGANTPQQQAASTALIAKSTAEDYKIAFDNLKLYEEAQKELDKLTKKGHATDMEYLKKLADAKEKVSTIEEDSVARVGDAWKDMAKEVLDSLRSEADTIFGSKGTVRTGSAGSHKYGNQAQSDYNAGIRTDLDRLKAKVWSGDASGRDVAQMYQQIYNRDVASVTPITDGTLK